MYGSLPPASPAANCFRSLQVSTSPYSPLATQDWLPTGQALAESGGIISLQFDDCQTRKVLTHRENKASVAAPARRPVAGCAGPTLVAPPPAAVSAA